MTKEKKQFIAGASCPSCGEEDSLVLFAVSKDIACVSCDFKQSSQSRDEKATETRKNAVTTIKITQVD